jgi:hypothetical protein
MKERTRIIGLAIVGVFAVLQLFPIDKTNPPSDPAQDFMMLENPPEQVALLLKNACYDCHSHHTKYPWYTNLQPIGWWIKGHFEGARKHLNFSEWGGYELKKKLHKMEECADEVEATKMPLMTYWLMHPEAKLSEEERKVLVDYFISKSK